MGSANSIGCTALSQTERMIISANALRNIGHNGINCNSRGCPTLVDTMQKFSGNQTIPVYTVDSSNYVGCMSRCHTDRERVMVSHKLSGNSLRGIVHSGMSHSSRGCSSLVDTMRKFNGNSLVILPRCPTLPGAVRRFTGNNLAFYSTSQNKKHFPMPQKPLGINVPQLPVLPYHILHPKTKGPTPLLPLPRLRTYDWMPEFHEPVVDFDQFLKCFPGPMNPGSSIGIPDHYMVFDPVQYVKFNRFFQKTEVQGTHPTWRPWIMTDFAKRLERSLILLLVIYHKLDLCFSNLTLDDLYICCDGTFKVKKVLVLRSSRQME